MAQNVIGVVPLTGGSALAHGMALRLLARQRDRQGAAVTLGAFHCNCAHRRGLPSASRTCLPAVAGRVATIDSLFGAGIVRVAISSDDARAARYVSPACGKWLVALGVIADIHGTSKNHPTNRSAGCGRIGTS